MISLLIALFGKKYFPPYVRYMLLGIGISLLIYRGRKAFLEMKAADKAVAQAQEQAAQAVQAEVASRARAKAKAQALALAAQATVKLKKVITGGGNNPEAEGNSNSINQITAKFHPIFGKIHHAY